jgi:hypothetical protein
MKTLKSIILVSLVVAGLTQYAFHQLDKTVVGNAIVSYATINADISAYQ